MIIIIVTKIEKVGNYADRLRPPIWCAEKQLYM